MTVEVTKLKSVRDADAEQFANSGEKELIFPDHLSKLIESDPVHPFTFITHNNINSSVKHLCLPIPTGLQLNDGASYEGLDTADFKGAEFLKRAQTSGQVVSDQDALVLGLRTASNIPMLDKVSDQLLFKSRVASNPMTEMTFQGNSMRVLALNFNMTPRNETEANSIRDIINTLRRLMYAEPTGASGYTVRYPAMFRIQFMVGENESKFFPVFYDCFLTTLQTNYGAQTGGFIKVNDHDSMYQQVSIALEFAEGKMLTRKDLYGDSGQIAPIPNRGAMKNENPDQSAIIEAKQVMNQMKRKAAEDNKTETGTETQTSTPPNLDKNKTYIDSGQYKVRSSRHTPVFT